MALSQYANEHDEDNEAQGLHDVYFDAIGLSKVVWGNTGTKHLVTKGGSKGQRVLSGPQGEAYEQFRIGGLAGASIDMSLITFLLVFQRSGDVQSEEEGPQSIGGDEANLVVRASESGLAILADKAEAMLSTLLDCDHAPLNRRLGWKVRKGAVETMVCPSSVNSTVSKTSRAQRSGPQCGGCETRPITHLRRP